MTIREKIDQTLAELQKSDRQLYDTCYRLYKAIQSVIAEASDHLSKIQSQMPDYDQHNQEHGKKVIENIELLLQKRGIEDLTLLEAMLIELCGYFHDTGMAVPDWSFKLLEEAEDPDYPFHRADTPVRSIASELALRSRELYGTYDQVKNLFFCPESEQALLTFLAQELWAYECYRMGLAKPQEQMERKTYLKLTRQEYLRSTHGRRTKTYAQYLGKKLEGLDEYDAGVIASSVGKICCGHCQDIREVQRLSAKIQIAQGQTSGQDFTYNERYVAMLLRLGDVIHFSSDRTSRTLYAEHTPMNPVSDSHWQVKMDNLQYRIEQREGKTAVSYFGVFKKPKIFYFLQDYLNWVDDEFNYYAAFVQDMEQLRLGDAARYRIGLPTAADRSGIKPLGFSPDSRLKFRLEQKKVIELLMGMRLYSSEWMCLRELYQNALDACRCMKAQNLTDGLKGEFPIEWGLAADENGDYLYCRDAGVGMTKDLILNYLLQVGNSYYRSADFRRENALWGNAVSPVSEFGIGLLSCYMIADRIEVITRHYAQPSEVFWVCMEGTEDYGYFREAPVEMAEQVGGHGTMVKVYLKEKFRGQIKACVPENVQDVVYLYHAYAPEVIKGREYIDELFEGRKISEKIRQALAQFQDCLYQKLQEYVQIPEDGIPVYVTDEMGRKHKMIASNDMYVFSEKADRLAQYEIPLDRIRPDPVFLEEDSLYDPQAMAQFSVCAKQLAYYRCRVTDDESQAEAYSILHLPRVSYTGDLEAYSQYDGYVGLRGEAETVYIDGIPVRNDCEGGPAYLEIEQGMHVNFRGGVRPMLTVNREDIREVPQTVDSAVKRLQIRLLEETARVILAHFEKYPSAKTQRNLQCLDHYLGRKYSLKAYYDMMKTLAGSVFEDYCVCGNRMADLISYRKFSIDASIPVEMWRTHSLIYGILLSQAKKIRVDDSAVTVEAGEIAEEDVDDWLCGRDWCILSDEWEGKYRQYDMVDSLWPLMPERVYSRWKGAFQWKKDPYAHFKRMGPTNIGSYLSDIGIRLFEQRGRYNWISRSDILMLLSSTPADQISCRCPIHEIADEKNRKYVLFAFVNPRKLSEKEEEELSRFAHIPEYVRGAREGWSILFYRFEDGYVIAPGRISREEMISRIPEAARRHSDGITYCFTDGSVAF